MSVFNKFFSFIFGCLLFITGIIVCGDGLGLTYVTKVLAQFWQGGIEGTITLVVGAATFILGAAIILANLCIRPPKSVRVPGTARTNAVYVTLNTIENMAKTTAMAVPGVVAVHTKIKSKKRGLCLTVRISVSFDDKINHVTEQLQKDIRSLIEGSTALPVSSVAVLVVKAAGEKNAADYRKEPPQGETTLPFESEKGE